MMLAKDLAALLMGIPNAIVVIRGEAPLLVAVGEPEFRRGDDQADVVIIGADNATNPTALYEIDEFAFERSDLLLSIRPFTHADTVKIDVNDPSVLGRRVRLTAAGKDNVRRHHPHMHEYMIGTIIGLTDHGYVQVRITYPGATKPPDWVHESTHWELIPEISDVGMTIACAEWLSLKWLRVSPTRRAAAGAAIEYQIGSGKHWATFDPLEQGTLIEHLIEGLDGAAGQGLTNREVVTHIALLQLASIKERQ